jgi:restriction system protein
MKVPTHASTATLPEPDFHIPGADSHESDLDRGWNEDKRFGFRLLERCSVALARTKNRWAVSPRAGWNLPLLQALEWRALNGVAAGFFRQLGFRPIISPGGSHLGGVDIWLYQEEDAGRMGAVRCLPGPARGAGVKPVQELAAILDADHVRHGVVIATGIFTAEARLFAGDRSIELIDGEDLLRKVSSLPPETQTRLLKEATRGHYTIPSCPQCGQKMIPRAAQFANVWTCRSSPRCRGKLSA